MPTARKPLSKRARFEILKRDGFRCRYCGVTPQVRVLRVDHVVPVSKGGTNDAANLVTACDPCNAGKSDRLLGDTHLNVMGAPEDLKEQARQVRLYLKAMKDLDSARDEVVLSLVRRWEERIGSMSRDMANRMRSLLGIYPADALMKAIDAVGKSRMASPGAQYRWEDALNQQKYFSGVLRNMREKGEIMGVQK
jgi:hypothetical protein